MNCAKIAGDVVAAICCEPAVGGTYGDVILINYSSVDRGLSTVENGVITNLALKVGEQAYKYEALENVPLGAATLEKGTYVSYWQHDVTLRYLVKTECVKQHINNLACGRIIAIVHNKEQGAVTADCATSVEGQMAYEVYGWDSGLELNEATGTTEIADGVVYELTIGSGENSKEKTLPKTLWYGTLADTEAAIEGLLEPTPAPEP